MILALIISISLESCFRTASNSSTGNQNSEILDSLNTNQRFHHQYFSIVSPYQAGIELKRANAIYRPELTNPADNFSNYSSSQKKALNLGIYGADFAYLALFNDQKQFTSYLKALKNLSLELNIDDAFDKTIINQIEKNSDNTDSVLRLISLIYYDTDTYLKKNMRQDIAILIITGGWIESMYFLCNEYKETKNNLFYQYISNQKQTLDNIITQLAVYYDKDREINKLTDLLVDIAYEFDAITCKSTLTDSTTNYPQGLIHIHNKTTVQNDSKSINSIVSKVFELRKIIVQ